MTRAEYLEFVQERMAFGNKPEDGDSWPQDDVLRDTPEVCAALSMAHAEYCAAVEKILFPERAAQVDEELAGHKMLVGLTNRSTARTAAENADLDRAFGR